MADATRPIIGIENRTAQEVFDIMCDRIKAASPPAREAGRDLPDEFEAWWATHPHRNREPADYNVKKAIAFSAFYYGVSLEPPAEGAGDDAQWLLDNYGAGHPRIQRIAAALRNRTSEPAREAVAWRIKNKNTGLLQLQAQPLADLPFNRERFDCEPLFTHPAPATADKLRVAKLALEKIADEAPYRSGYCQSDVEYGPKLSDIEMQTVARQALAALNEQPQ